MREHYFPQDESRDLQSRIYWLFALIMLASLLLLLRAWHLQVSNGKYYLDLSENNRLRFVETPPPRGRIFDRHGALLVNNVPSFNLYVVLEDMSEPRTVLARLAEMIQMNPEEISRRLALKKEDPYVPIKIKEDLSMKEVAQVEGHSLELPGVKIEAEFKRNALYGTLAAHLLGYVGEISQNQMESGLYQNVKRGGIIGQYGIEQTYDSMIRGKPGQKNIEVDALGHERRVLKINAPVQGDDIFLTIDLNVQKAAEEALAGRPGAVVALDPNNGDVLAMVSHPAFNPNVLSKGASSEAWEALLKDTKRPLTNRVIHGQYPPGSTFKIVMAAALLESKTASAASRVECRGFLHFGNRNFRDWKKGGHGSVDIHRALVESCDVYFYEMGNRLGVDTISKFSNMFGLGQPTGIALASEKGGLIPSTEWKRRVRKEPWFPGETLSVSIGQGYVSTTPLQLATMIGAVAGNGNWYPPQLLAKRRNYETGAVEEVPSSEGKPLQVSAETLLTIRSALADVVSDPHGTAFKSQSKLVSMGGKTGTAQVVAIKGDTREAAEGFNDHAWFVAFAPVEDPKVAVVVLVENGGHGGATAAPLARSVVEAYLAPSSPSTVTTVNAPAPPPPQKPLQRQG
jgi:penicillin-binding protein 2